MIATLALTTGAATAVFSIVDGVLPEAAGIPRISGAWSRLRRSGASWPDRTPTVPVNEQHFRYWRAHSQTFEVLALAQYVDPAGEPDRHWRCDAKISIRTRQWIALRASCRCTLRSGRTLTPADEPSDRPEVAVMTDSCWRQRFRIGSRDRRSDHRGRRHASHGSRRPSSDVQPSDRAACCAGRRVRPDSHGHRTRRLGRRPQQ